MKTKQPAQIVIITALFLMLCSMAQAKPERVKAQEGDPCDQKTFVESCDGTILLYCEKDVVQARDCSHHGIDGLAETCVEFEIGAAQALYYAKCMSEEERCYDENSTYKVETILGLGESLKHTFKCEKTTNGDFFYRSSAGDKYERIHDRISKGKSNQEESENYLGKHGGESCDKENALFEFCETDKKGKAFEIIYRCEKSRNGDVLHLRRHSQTECYYGTGMCSADEKCIQGDKCDQANFVPYCEGNTAFNCQSDRITQRICNKALTCLVIDDQAKCITTKNNACQNEGEIVPTQCVNNNEFYRECKKTSDGKLYYVSAGHKKCSNGCKDDKSACNP
ncbi:MAG: hypothetical protein J6A01_12415 [Proteobacteria bacterium]|nr:hypothetical protein [Pseudomonadota bacterium]